MSESRGCVGNLEELQKLLTKYVLISIIAILSNLLSSIWFAITDILIFTYFDVFINPICLILMQIQHDDIYTCCCKYCHKSLAKLMHFTEAANISKNDVYGRKIKSIPDKTMTKMTINTNSNIESTARTMVSSMNAMPELKLPQLTPSNTKSNEGHGLVRRPEKVSNITFVNETENGSRIQSSSGKLTPIKVNLSDESTRSLPYRSIAGVRIRKSSDLDTMVTLSEISLFPPSTPK